MRVLGGRLALRQRRVDATIAAGVLIALAALAAALPAGAPAGQSSQATPQPVAQVGAGLYHSCALLDTGVTPAPAGFAVRCWGFSGDGQVGYGNTTVIGDDETPAAAGPVDLGAGRTAKALALGDYHTCAVLDDGTVRCWGYGNEGQLGYGSRNHVGDNEHPSDLGAVNIGAGRTATAITAGGNHTCALRDDGTVLCWGLGEFGQLGNGGTASIGDGELPGDRDHVDLGGQPAIAITAGAFHSCALLADGSVKCWGVGGNGQLGYAGTGAVLDPAEKPDPVDLGAPAKAITAGASHTCAVLADGSVRCWGLNDLGQLGYGNTVSIGDNEAPSAVGPVDLGPGRTAIAISAGGEHTCVVLDNGSARCWGSGLYGQLGYGNLDTIGDNEPPAAVGPVDLGPAAGAVAIAAGIYHTCARLEDRSVRCWGNGADGRLGVCAREDVGDDEAPGSVGTVDLGFGGAACPPPPPAPVTTPPPPPAVVPPAQAAPAPAPLAAPLAGPSRTAAALRAERARRQRLRDCRAGVARRARSERGRALRRHRRGSRLRARAVRTAARRAAQGRVRCLKRFARRPGRITTVAARADDPGSIVLTFRAPGSDGSRPPAARAYLVKQSVRPIRTADEFRRAPALCRGACTFDVTEPRASITLKVIDLRRRTTYYYAVAARDNVSSRAGPRSRTVRATTR
ncbi:MAG: RCC1 domain-containing protein [Thermoleophilia bacterium]